MYIGSSPNFGALDSQTITSANGSTATFTLNQYVPDSDSIIVTVGNVVQEPTEAYTASGNSITFTENVPNGDTIVIRYLGRSVDVYTGYKRVQRFKYVATNGQQTFTGADANSRTLEYTAQDIDVFYNGVRLDESEFTASNGSSVILATGATTNAELVILAYKVVQLADVVPASSGGTFTGNVVFSGNATVNGNLTASGTTTLVDTTNTVIKDNLLGLNHGATSNSNDAGIIVERGSTGNDALFIWDESEDKWALGTTTSNASSTGNLNMTTGTLVANLEGTIQTASQTNITSVGTLTGLTVSGDASVGDDLSLNSDGAIINFGVDSDVTLTHVHDAGIKLNDDKILYIGDDQDFQLFHNNSSSLQVIKATHRLLIRSPRIDFQNGDGTETTGVSIADGVFALFHDNTERLSTNANGVNLNSTSVSGNPANAKFIVNSSSQYDGIALGTGASSAVIGRHSNGAGMHFTANSAPANMGGGDKAGFVFSSGSSGGGGPSDILQINTDGRVRIGSGSPETGVQLEINALDNHAISARSNGGNGNNRRFNLTPFASGGTYGGGFILETRNSSNIFTEAMRFGFDGSLRLQHVYDDTTSFSANMYIHSDGVHQVFRSTSSERYKKDIETLEDKYADAVLGLRPVWYKSKCKADNPDYSHWGLIAEEVAKVDPRLVTFRTEITKRYRDKETEEEIVETTKLDEPQAESVQYERFVPHLINICKRQEDKITALEAKVKVLEKA